MDDTEVGEDRIAHGKPAFSFSPLSQGLVNIGLTSPGYKTFGF